MKSLSRVRLFATPWTVAHQAPPSMGFSKQEYWHWLAISFSRVSSWHGDRIQVSHIADRRFNLWATRKGWRLLIISPFSYLQSPIPKFPMTQLYPINISSPSPLGRKIRNFFSRILTWLPHEINLFSDINLSVSVFGSCILDKNIWFSNRINKANSVLNR